jgi:hypothetical protein
MSLPNRWVIGGGFVINAETEDEADKAMRALERAGARALAEVNLYVHGSEEDTNHV